LGDKYTVSVEHLAHFQCGHCKKWWSIGDAPVREYWFCPWCGAKLKVQKIKWQPEILNAYSA